MNEELELPPAAFTNRINSLRHDGLLRKSFDFRKWRKSPEWRLFVAGYNASVEACGQRIKALHNLGESGLRIFGDER
jgi:hypothetical protein